MYTPDSYLFTAVSGTKVSAATAPGVQLLAANVHRRSFYVFNDSPSVLFIKLGTSVSTSDYTVQIPALGLYEAAVPIPTTAVWGVWASASGSAQVTEVS